MFRCLSGCLLGFADRAVGHADDAVILGEALGHPRSLAMALYYAAVIHHFRGEPEVAVERAEAALAICAEHGIVATGTQILHDCARFDLGEHDAASQMAERVRALRRSGTSVMWPLQLALLAEADCRSGRIDEGFRYVDEALTYVERTGERWTDSELFRIKGELLLARSAGDWQQAAGSFETAIGVARSQGARALELRAATRLAQVRAENGQVAVARQVLSVALDGIEEGQGISDIEKARTLMTQIDGVS